MFSMLSLDFGILLLYLDVLFRRSILILRHAIIIICHPVFILNNRKNSGIFVELLPTIDVLNKPQYRIPGTGNELSTNKLNFVEVLYIVFPVPPSVRLSLCYCRVVYCIVL